MADFMDITRQYGIEWVAYTEEELEAELKEAMDLGKAVKSDRQAA